MTARLPAISHQRMRVMCTQLHPILYMIWVHTIVKIWKSIESLLQVALFSKPYKPYKVISSSSLVCCNLVTWTNVYVGKGWANVRASSGRRISWQTQTQRYVCHHLHARLSTQLLCYCNPCSSHSIYVCGDDARAWRISSLHILTKNMVGIKLLMSQHEVIVVGDRCVYRMVALF